MSVIQLRRTKGWRKPEGAVVVARPSKWGNPFAVGGEYVIDDEDGVGVLTVRTRSDAAEIFGAWLTGQSLWVDNAENRRSWMLDHLHELAGKTLACWCPQPGPCHAHVLAELANATERTEP